MTTSNAQPNPDNTPPNQDEEDRGRIADMDDLSGGDDGVSTLGHEDDEPPAPPAGENGDDKGKGEEQPKGDDEPKAKETDSEVASAMRAGWKTAKRNAGQIDDAGDDKPSAKGKKPSAKDETPDIIDGQIVDGDQSLGEEQTDEDQEIKGLGMKPSEVKAALGRIAALEKSLASANGSIGYLKGALNKSGGAAITKESLKRVAEEFGPEFADALADDLKGAGLGSGGAQMDPEAINSIVNERITAMRDEMQREHQRDLVNVSHPDAADYFAAPVLDADGKPKVDANGTPLMNMGKHHVQFLKFLDKLPQDRKDELQDCWDHKVISRAITEFKATQKAATNAKANARERFDRATLPTGSRGAAVAAPQESGLMTGWKKAKGLNTRQATRG